MPVIAEGNCKQLQETICVGSGKEDGANACGGDTGGPLMCPNSDGTWTVHGVGSVLGEHCKDYTAYSPIHKYVAWIQKYVSEIHHD